MPRVCQTAALSNVSNFPAFAPQGDRIRRLLDRDGYVLVKGFPISLPPEERNALFLAVASSVGTPVSHLAEREQYLWDIIPKASSSKVPTFSEHSAKAALHTDTSYRLAPERYIANLAIRPAADGGGKTTILDIRPVLADLERTAEGRRGLRILREERFPILVPTVFRVDKTVEKELITAPVLAAEPFVRFRFDTFLQGLEHVFELETNEKAWALKFFNRHVEESRHIVHLDLEPGDICFLNNHLVLHGRTGFSDSQRFLQRIRMN